MIVTLTVIKGPHLGQAFEFREHDTFIVGRSKDAHFRLPIKDKTLSRFHFMVEVNPPCCRLMDMASRNGTSVNGLRVSVSDLKDGDTIEGGRSVLAISIKRDPVGPESSAEIDSTHPPSRVPKAVGLRRPSTSLVRTGRFLDTTSRRCSAKGEWESCTRRAGSRTEPSSRSRRLPRRSLGPRGRLRGSYAKRACCAQLDHPHIVRFERLGHAGGRLFFAMEFVPGLDAGALLKKQRKPLSVGLAVGLICQALDALAYAHELGFVHRDIKPTNVLVARKANRPRVKLADFGLARIYLTSPLSGLTITGHVAGTSGFMAPKQITDFRKVRPAADQYSAGAMLYYLLCGKKVYDFPPEIQNQLLMILQDKPVPIPRRADVPGELAAIIDRALARCPQIVSRMSGQCEALQPFASSSASPSRVHNMAATIEPSHDAAAHRAGGVLSTSARGHSPSLRLTSVALRGLDSIPLERLKKRLKVRLIVSPSADRAGMDGLANLHEAGCAHHARIGMESRHEGSQSRPTKSIRRRRMMFQVGDHIFVRELETGQRSDAFPVRHDPLIISQSPRDVVPIIVP